ncbi:hypothetical protein [Moorena bouillonii]|uniref:hypothetical protein n=1 Tax=Moorena bouillonii TaxID=207920 RepID=UPI001BE0B9A0|nr:hypothetical protein [Moorena bouillonii]
MYYNVANNLVIIWELKNYHMVPIAVEKKNGNNVDIGSNVVIIGWWDYDWR